MNVHYGWDIMHSQSAKYQSVNYDVLDSIIPVPRTISWRTIQSTAPSDEMAGSNDGSDSMPCNTLAGWNNWNTNNCWQHRTSSIDVDLVGPPCWEVIGGNSPCNQAILRYSHLMSVWTLILLVMQTNERLLLYLLESSQNLWHWKIHQTKPEGCCPSVW